MKVHVIEVVLLGVGAYCRLDAYGLWLLVVFFPGQGYQYKKSALLFMFYDRFFVGLF